MDDVAYEVQKERVLAAWGRWREPLGLDRWRVQHHFHDGQFVNEDGHPSGTDCPASSAIRWQYLGGSVNWNVAMLAAIDDEEFGEIVLHEAMHFVLAELADTNGRAARLAHEERVATVLARAMIDVAGEREAS